MQQRRIDKLETTPIHDQYKEISYRHPEHHYINLLLILATLNFKTYFKFSEEQNF
jgi:hypothetical protein